MVLCMLLCMLLCTLYIFAFLPGPDIDRGSLGNKDPMPNIRRLLWKGIKDAQISRSSCIPTLDPATWAQIDTKVRHGQAMAEARLPNGNPIISHK